MSQNIFVNVSEEFLSVQKALDFVDAKENGAADIFVGKVRNHNLGKEVKAVTYDAFIPLACNEMRKLCEEAIEKFGNQLRCYIEHYKGRLELGGISVIIAIGSPHRDESFKACRYLIEELKVRVPVWKQEHYVDGDADWLDGHQLSK
jgi:molybdopterin synthase catalytic subunit